MSDEERLDDAALAREWATRFVMGDLDSTELAEFEARTADPDSVTSQALSELSGVVESMARDCDAGPPPAHIGDALLRRVDEESPELLFDYAAGAEWQPTGIPGVDRRPLATDPERGTQSFLLRMARGSTVPAHPHYGAEECLVLEGDLQTHGRTLVAGDYMRAPAGSTHEDSSTENGCLMLIVTSIAA